MSYRRCPIVALLVVSVLMLVLCPSRVFGQGCEPRWLPGDVGQLVQGEVRAFATVDPDGPGPLPVWLIAGGRDVSVPGLPGQKVIAFDGTRWRSLDNGPRDINSYVYAMTVFNNELYAAGYFSSIDGVPASSIARWNGTSWAPLGGGVTGGYVYSLAAVGGFLFVGGSFSQAGGLSTQSVARWDGGGWAAIGGVNAGGFVRALVGFQGSLYAGGSFTSVGGVAATNLASYGPVSGVWSQAGQPNGVVTTLGQYTGDTIASPRLFVGGTFSTIGGVAIPTLARYAPSTNTWTSLGTLPAGTPLRLLVRSTGLTYQLSAIFGSSSSGYGRFNILDSSGWHTLGTPDDFSCMCSTVYGGQYVVGRMGQYPETANHVKAWNSTDWVGLGEGAPGQIFAITALPGGDVAVAVRANYGLGSSAGVYRHHVGGHQWTLLGGLFTPSGTIDDIRGLVALPNGDVVAGGSFDGAGGVSARFLARWNGSAWSAMGAFNGSVLALAVMPNGDVLAGGSFSTIDGVTCEGIARWNGSAWAPVGGGVNGSVYAMRVLSNGSVVVVGAFSAAGGVPANRVARWDGVSWSAYGAGIQIPNTSLLAVEGLDDGTLLVGGQTPDASGQSYVPVAARWDGSAWNSPGVGFGQVDGYAVTCITKLPDGSAAVGGIFTNAGGIAVHSVARWDGAWHAMSAEGLSYDGVFTSGLVSSLAMLPDGTLAAGGLFSHAGGGVSACFALWGTPAGCSACDSVDFNRDTLFPDITDINDFLSVFAGGPCSTSPVPGCGDIDFNNDGLFPDTADIDALLRVFSGGACE